MQQGYFGSEFNDYRTNTVTLTEVYSESLGRKKNNFSLNEFNVVLYVSSLLIVGNEPFFLKFEQSVILQL